MHEYYVGTDHLGSPRVVRGRERRRRSEDRLRRLGNQTALSGFVVPLGYAGGLADPVTGFVHFGMRDYDPATARFTTRDPMLFDGGGNLFVYVGDDPMSAVDPAGLTGVGASAYAGVGGGASTSLDDKGISFCGEVGFGLGQSAEINTDSYTLTSVSAGV